MTEEQKKGVRVMVFAQSFVEALDQFEGNSQYRHQLKNKGKSFMVEMDKFLDDVYAQGGSEMCGLIEACQNAMDEVLDNQVEVVESD